MSAEQLEGLLSYLGQERRLVLVTGYGPARTTWIPGANQTIQDYAAAHPEQVA
ncbi:MAG: Lipopolysaccharide modification acyltransferase, partial [Actinomyces urogenitalis DORA_12]